MNEFSASDGDLFPYRFRHYKLGARRNEAGAASSARLAPLRRRRLPQQTEFASSTARARSGSSKTTASIQTSSSTTTLGRISRHDQQLTRGIEIILEELSQLEGAGRRRPVPQAVMGDELQAPG